VVRVLVGLAAVALLVDSAGPGRADYIFICQLPGPGNGDERFPNSRRPAVDPAGNATFADTIEPRVEGSSSDRVLLTDFDNRSGRPTEPGDPAMALMKKIIAGDKQKSPTGPLPADGIFCDESISLGIGGLQFRNGFSLDPALCGTFVAADALDLRKETAGSDEPHIVRFGSLANPDAPFAGSNRVGTASLPAATVPDKANDHKVIVIIALGAVIVLGALGYLWRRRRRRLHRALRGPRRPTVYRSPSLPKPPSPRR
jgi:LPXTG-motif cell wall-anchored protein